MLAAGDEIEIMIQEGLAVPPNGLVGTKTLDGGFAQAEQHFDTIICPANAVEHSVIIVAFLEAGEEEVDTALCAHAVGLDGEKVKSVVDLERPLVSGVGPREANGGCGEDLDAKDILWWRRSRRATRFCGGELCLLRL